MAATEMQTHNLKRGNWIDIGTRELGTKNDGSMDRTIRWSSRENIRGGDYIDLAIAADDPNVSNVCYSRLVHSNGQQTQLRRAFAEGIGLSAGDRINIWIRPTQQPISRSVNISDHIPCGEKTLTARSEPKPNGGGDGLVGKCTIPKKKRDLHNIRADDIVLAVMAFDDTTFSFRSFVDATGGITIPKEIRVANNLQAGDTCEWWVRKEDTPAVDDGVSEDEPKSDDLQQFMDALQEDGGNEAEDSTRSGSLEEIPDDPEVIKLSSADDDVHYVTDRGRSTVCGKDVPPDSPTALESELGVFDSICPACEEIGPIPYDRDQLQKRIREICGLDADGMAGMELQNGELYDVLRVLTED